VKMTIHFHLATRLRMLGATSPLSRFMTMTWFLFKHRDKFTLPL